MHKTWLSKHLFRKRIFEETQKPNAEFSNDGKTLYANITFPSKETSRNRKLCKLFFEERFRSFPKQLESPEILTTYLRNSAEINEKILENTLFSLAHSLTKVGNIHMVRQLVEVAKEYYPKASGPQLQLILALLRQGEVTRSRDELLKLLPLKNKWVARESIALAMAMTHWEFINAAIPQCDQIRHNGLLDKNLERMRALARCPSYKGDNSDIPVLCINLDRDKHRYLAVESLYTEKQCKIKRYPGIYGASVPSLAKGAIFNIDPPPNVIGCCMSHLSVWESIANGKDTKAIIIEDDGLPCFDFQLETLTSKLDKDFDICFINDRAYESWTLHPENLECVPIMASHKLLVGDERAIGADGYILSKQGAEKLLELISATKISGNLDWMLYALGLGPQYLYSDTHVDKLLKKIHSRMNKSIKFNAYVSSVPFVAHYPLGFTARHHFS